MAEVTIVSSPFLHSTVRYNEGTKVQREIRLSIAYINSPTLGQGKKNFLKNYKKNWKIFKKILRRIVHRRIILGRIVLRRIGSAELSPPNCLRRTVLDRYFIISLLFPQLVEILPLGLHVDLLVHDVNVARYRFARVITGKNVVLTVEYMKPHEFIQPTSKNQNIKVQSMSCDIAINLSRRDESIDIPVDMLWDL